MYTVLNIAGPVFGLGVIGYIAARMGWFGSRSIEGLSRFVFDWAVPCLLIRTFSSTALPEDFPWTLLLAFYLPAAACYLALALFARRVFRRDFGGAVITGFCGTFGNSVLVGVPLVLLTFGEQGAIPFFILLSFHGLSYFSVTTVLMEYGTLRGGRAGALFRQVVLALFTNPIIIALVIGLGMNALDLRLPGPVDRIAEYLQQAVTPCALFALGASLTHYGIVGQVRQTLAVVTVKNLLLPALVWLMGSVVLDLPAQWTMVAVLLAATPTGVNAFLFAERYDRGKALASTSVFLSTALSIVTLSLLTYFFTHPA